MSSTQVTPLGSYRGSSPALDRRGWNLALGFQEVFTAVVRLRYNRQAVSDAETFRAQMRQALRVAEQEARSRGCSAEDVKQVIFAVVAFLDESVLTSRNPVFVNWPRLPLQAELFGHQLAGEIFFQELQKVQRLPGDRGSAGSLLPVPVAGVQREIRGGRRPAVSDGRNAGEDPAHPWATGSTVAARRHSSGRGSHVAHGSRKSGARSRGADYGCGGCGALCSLQVCVDVGCVVTLGLGGWTAEIGGWDVLDVLGDRFNSADLHDPGVSARQMVTPARQ
jgi:hypothetical protein